MRLLTFYLEPIMTLHKFLPFVTLNNFITSLYSLFYYLSAHSLMRLLAIVPVLIAFNVLCGLNSLDTLHSCVIEF